MQLPSFHWDWKSGETTVQHEHVICMRNTNFIDLRMTSNRVFLLENRTQGDVILLVLALVGAVVVILNQDSSDSEETKPKKEVKAKPKEGEKETEAEPKTKLVIISIKRFVLGMLPLYL